MSHKDTSWPKKYKAQKLKSSPLHPIPSHLISSNEISNPLKSHATVFRKHRALREATADRLLGTFISANLSCTQLIVSGHRYLGFESRRRMRS
ncbi:unnamed protein product [Rhodiola kirilowii]